MKAFMYEEYGPSQNLHVAEVEKPEPGDNEVLVKVAAVSINDWDWGLLTGTPFANRAINGLLNPRRKIVGSDIAGRVEAVGRKITRLKIGDEVYGDLSNRWGGCAEYVVAPEEMLGLKPPSMTFAEAAAIPQAGGSAHLRYRS